ncbi:MAG TPA: hypothetical protein IAC82_08420 [Candidatus Merdivicinus intestinigallinarum]|nr:hypothetical protein [Candidatus Merdivicinus intestinigallinarum]
MKRVVIGGLLFLTGTVGTLSILLFAGNERIYPNSSLDTIEEFGMTLPFWFSVLLVLLGLVILGIEYFKKDD